MAPSSAPPTEGLCAILFCQNGPKQWPDWQAAITALTSAIATTTSTAPETIETKTRILDDNDANKDTNHSRVVEIRFSGPASLSSKTCASLRSIPSVMDCASLHNLSLVLRPAREWSKPGLVVFDMDSTLVYQETIDEMARVAGPEIYEAVRAITDAIMRDPSIVFLESLRRRIAYFKGLDAPRTWNTLLGDGEQTGKIRFTKGVQRAVRVLNNTGWTTAVLSGGFAPAVEWAREKLGLHYSYANELECDEKNRLTGRLVDGARIVDGQEKSSLLRDIARRSNISSNNVIAVGDGSNDLPMMFASAMGVAFNAKPKIQEEAPVVLNTDSMLDLLYVLGYTQSEIDRASE